MTISAPLQDIKREISVIKQSYNIKTQNILILGACKTQPSDVIEATIQAGLTDFGENRVQEAETKWPELKKHHPNIRLHLIGPLQTNKVKSALALFDVIQTLDRPKLAEAIASSQNKETRCRGLFIQINTGKEPQKAGIMPEEADAFIRYCIADLNLPVMGLMCIPPEGQPPAPHFALLKKIADRHGLKELSMGMSEDYATAIRMGSTCIRIGRKLFGERQVN
jgi:pyridoxal phosphate enzyme (YggS family)